MNSASMETNFPVSHVLQAWEGCNCQKISSSFVFITPVFTQPPCWRMLQPPDDQMYLVQIDDDLTVMGWNRWVGGGLDDSQKQRQSLQSFYAQDCRSRIHGRTISLRFLSGHNLESSQTWGFCMDFLNHGQGGIVFYQVFLLSPVQCTVTEL
jgi:hypothetical protein